MIDLDPSDLAEVKTILQKHLPGVEVRAFGSRITGKAKQYSDLDLVVIDKKAISIDVLNNLKFEFSNSNLPIMIDIVDWHTISSEFRKLIQADCRTLIANNSE